MVSTAFGPVDRHRRRSGIAQGMQRDDDQDAPTAGLVDPDVEERRRHECWQQSENRCHHGPGSFWSDPVMKSARCQSVHSALTHRRRHGGGASGRRPARTRATPAPPRSRRGRQQPGRTGLRPRATDRRSAGSTGPRRGQDRQDGDPDPPPPGHPPPVRQALPEVPLLDSAVTVDPEDRSQRRADATEREERRRRRLSPGNAEAGRRPPVQLHTQWQRIRPEADRRLTREAVPSRPRPTYAHHRAPQFPRRLPMRSHLRCAIPVIDTSGGWFGGEEVAMNRSALYRGGAR